MKDLVDKELIMAKLQSGCSGLGSNGWRWPELGERAAVRPDPPQYLLLPDGGSETHLT